MVSKEDWKKAMDAAMTTLGVFSGVGLLHKAIVEHHGNKYNTALNVAMQCGRCSKEIYFGLQNIAASYFQKDAVPPNVTCPHCNHSGTHRYLNIQ